jgi:hypothetical protein
VQQVILAMARNRRLLLPLPLARAPLSSRYRFVELLQQSRVPPCGLVQPAPMRIRQHEQIPALAMHQFE